MTSTPQTTSGLTGIAREEKRLDVGGQWIMKDYNQATVKEDVIDAPVFMGKLKLISNSTRTVALITAGDDPRLDEWRMVESDDPAVAAFVAQLVNAAKEDYLDETSRQMP